MSANQDPFSFFSAGTPRNNAKSAGKNGGANGAGGASGTSRGNSNTVNPRKFSPLAITVIVVVALILAFLAFASIYSEVLWFKQLGYLNVLLKQWLGAGVMFAIGFIGMAVPVLVAMIVAYRKRPVYARLTAKAEQMPQISNPVRKLFTVVIPVVVGFLAGITVADNWQTVFLWLNATPANVQDPLHKLDVSFYMFTLPFIRGIIDFFSATLIICALAAAITSFFYGGVAFGKNNVIISKATRIQLAIYATLYLAVQAASIFCDQYSVLANSNGIRTGAMFTDAEAVIPGKQILAAIGVLVSVLFIITAVTGKWRISLAGTGLFVISGLVLGAGYPWAVQQFQVKPDEKSLEKPYIERNIAATRLAYGIDRVQVKRYEATTDAAPGALRGDAEATANIRIIDPEVVAPTFSQLEQIKQYYQFPKSLNVDRYEIDGKIEDTVSAVRDIDVSAQNGWYNRTLVYTHGYGLVAAYGNQRSANGEPVFMESGIPTTGKLGEFEPRVYFGLTSPTYSIVGGKRDKAIEVDYPADAEKTANTKRDTETTEANPDTQTSTTKEETEKTEKKENNSTSRNNLTVFKGDGGPKLDSLLNKIVYALKFQDMEVLLSGAVVEGSQVLYDRNPLQRVQKVAPYLTLDGTVYPSVVDGKIVWIVDGYTTSANYPYSETKDYAQLVADSDNPPLIQKSKNINYIRNSVKATVDAYDGTVKLYAWDTKDPVLQTWSKIFPGTLESIEKMSGQLMSHVRYPSELFKVQRALLAEYHVTDADALYSAEDKWRTPDDPVSTVRAGTKKLPQPPYYLTFAAGHEAKPSFSIYSTFIPAAEGEQSRPILAGYLAADANAGKTAGEISEDYGKLTLLTLPKGDPVPGPGQVQNSFTTDAKVSQLLNILRQGESEVISGNLLTLPVGGGLLYVQPIYVKALSGTGYPNLQKVLVSFGDKIAFEDTLDKALDVLFGGNSGASAGDETPGDKTVEQALEVGDVDTGQGDTTATVNADATPQKPAADVAATTGKAEQLLQELQQVLSERDAAMKQGDWAVFGEKDNRLRSLIDSALK